MLAFNKSHVQRCREMWRSPQFAELFNAFCHSCQFSNVQSRLQLEEIDGLQLVMDVIREEKDEHLMGRAWIVIQNFVLVHSVDDPLEMKPIDLFVERRGVELAAIELSRPQPRWVQAILTVLAWTSTNERAVPRVIASGVHKVGISYVRENHPILLDISMSFIRSASSAESCRAILRADGALQAFIPFIECNKSTEPLQMRRGFRAASVVARLAGNDETGIGPTVLKSNPELITNTLNIFEQILEAGPDGTVINMLVNPHFITMDLLIISTADVNKAHLARAIPVCVQALKKRGESNAPMVADIVKMFLQLSFDSICKTELMKYSGELVELLGRLFPVQQQQTKSASKSTFYDSETLVAAQMLRVTLSQPVAPQTSPGFLSPSSSMHIPSPSGLPTTSSSSGSGGPSSNFVQGIMRRMVPSHRHSSSDLSIPVSASGSGEETSKPALVPPKSAVFICYSWQSSELARKLDDVLQQQGIRVWIDYRCMDRSPQDSLDAAMKECGAVIVLASTKLKENAVCRKELELAEEKKLPLVFVQAEESFRPEAWLSLLVHSSHAAYFSRLGHQQLMLPGWTGPLIKSSMPSLVKRLAHAAPSCLPSKPATHHHFPGKGSPVLTRQEVPANFAAPSDGGDVKLYEMLTNLTLTMNEMRRELNELRMEIKGMKSN